MSEKKDYQYPYFKKYMALVDEIEKLPASEQQTKVVTMFHEFYKDMRDSCELTSELSVKYIAKSAELQSTIATQADQIKRLKEDGEALYYCLQLGDTLDEEMCIHINKMMKEHAALMYVKLNGLE